MFFHILGKVQLWYSFILNIAFFAMNFKEIAFYPFSQKVWKLKNLYVLEIMWFSSVKMYLCSSQATQAWGLLSKKNLPAYSLKKEEFGH